MPRRPIRKRPQPLHPSIKAWLENGPVDDNFDYFHLLLDRPDYDSFERIWRRYKGDMPYQDPWAWFCDQSRFNKIKSKKERE